MSDWVWMEMVEGKLQVGFRPEDVMFLIGRKKRSMIIGEGDTDYVDVYVKGQDEDKPMRVVGTLREVAQKLGLPEPLELGEKGGLEPSVPLAGVS